jgi:hypothetical protein
MPKINKKFKKVFTLNVNKAFSHDEGLNSNVSTLKTEYSTLSINKRNIILRENEIINFNEEAYKKILVIYIK